MNCDVVIQREDIARLLEARRGGPEGMIRAVEGMGRELSEVEEMAVVCALTAYAASAWEGPGVREAARRARVRNERLGMVLALLADVEESAEARGRYVEALLGSRGRGALGSSALASLLTVLHRRGRVDVKEMFLRKLDWLTSGEVWGIAVQTLLVCAPEALTEGRLARLARLKCRRYRVLMDVCLGDGGAGRGKPARTPALRAGALGLSKLKGSAHKLAMLEVSWVWSERPDPGRCRELLAELARLGDLRDCEVLIRHLRPKEEAADATLLRELAEGKDERTAKWAKAEVKQVDS